jgi:hypothetical protein
LSKFMGGEPMKLATKVLAVGILEISVVNRCLRWPMWRSFASATATS